MEWLKWWNWFHSKCRNLNSWIVFMVSYRSWQHVWCSIQLTGDRDLILGIPPSCDSLWSYWPQLRGRGHKHFVSKSVIRCSWDIWDIFWRCLETLHCFRILHCDVRQSLAQKVHLGWKPQMSRKNFSNCCNPSKKKNMNYLSLGATTLGLLSGFGSSDSCVKLQWNWPSRHRIMRKHIQEKHCGDIW